MQRLDIDDLYLFQALSEELSLSAVAMRLGVDKSNVSRRIQKVEKLIGASVILRADTIQLTDAGRRFLALARNTLDEYNRFQDQIDLLHRGHINIRLMGNAAMMACDVPPIVEAVTAQHPNAEFTILAGTSSEILSSVLAGTVDIGFIPDNPATSGLLFHRYRTEKLVVVVSDSHPLARRNHVTFRQLAEYNIIGATDDRVITGIINAQARQAGIQLRHQVTVGDYVLQSKFATETKLGPAVMFESIAKKLRSGKVLELREDWAQQEIYLCLPNVRDRAPAVERTIDLLLENGRADPLPH